MKKIMILLILFVSFFGYSTSLEAKYDNREMQFLDRETEIYYKKFYKKDFSYDDFNNVLTSVSSSVMIFQSAEKKMTVTEINKNAKILSKVKLKIAFLNDLVTITLPKREFKILLNPEEAKKLKLNDFLIKNTDLILKNAEEALIRQDKNLTEKAKKELRLTDEETKNYENWLEKIKAGL